jgi:uridine kinase
MKVVAISGVSGCGKTSIIKQLSKTFSCPYLLFDDHTEENTYPSDMKVWFQNGADLSNIKTPILLITYVH